MIVLNLTFVKTIETLCALNWPVDEFLNECSKYFAHIITWCQRYFGVNAETICRGEFSSCYILSFQF
jgi:hypothetical protein